MLANYITYIAMIVCSALGLLSITRALRRSQPITARCALFYGLPTCMMVVGGLVGLARTCLGVAKPINSVEVAVLVVIACLSLSFTRGEMERRYS